MCHWLLWGQSVDPSANQWCNNPNPNPNSRRISTKSLRRNYVGPYFVIHFVIRPFWLCNFAEGYTRLQSPQSQCLAPCGPSSLRPTWARSALVPPAGRGCWMRTPRAPAVRPAVRVCMCECESEGERERESEGDKTANKTCSYPLTLDHPIKLRSNQTSFSMPAMGAALFIEIRLFFM